MALLTERSFCVLSGAINMLLLRSKDMKPLHNLQLPLLDTVLSTAYSATTR